MLRCYGHSTLAYLRREVRLGPVDPGAAWAFAIVRFLMGVGESAAFPVGNKMMGYWLGPNERALSTSIFLSGGGVAGVLAPVLITRMAINFGWRSPFLVLGIIGIVSGLACYVYVTDRPAGRSKIPALTPRNSLLSLVRPIAKRYPQGTAFRGGLTCRGTKYLRRLRSGC